MRQLRTQGHLHRVPGGTASLTCKTKPSTPSVTYLTIPAFVVLLFSPHRNGLELSIPFRLIGHLSVLRKMPWRLLYACLMTHSSPSIQCYYGCNVTALVTRLANIQLRRLAATKKCRICFKTSIQNHGCHKRPLASLRPCRLFSKRVPAEFGEFLRPHCCTAQVGRPFRGRCRVVNSVHSSSLQCCHSQKVKFVCYGACFTVSGTEDVQGCCYLPLNVMQCFCRFLFVFSKVYARKGAPQRHHYVDRNVGEGNNTVCPRKLPIISHQTGYSIQHLVIT